MKEEEAWGEARPEKIPAPTYVPAMLALGSVLLLWGLIAGWMISAVGGVLSALALAGWIRELLYE